MKDGMNGANGAEHWQPNAAAFSKTEAQRTAWSEHPVGFERMLRLHIDGRHSERIIKLHWLNEQRKRLKALLREWDVEAAALRDELKKGRGLGPPPPPLEG